MKDDEKQQMCQKVLVHYIVTTSSHGCRIFARNKKNKTIHIQIDKFMHIL